MAEIPDPMMLSEQKWKAGSEYLRSIQTLGLDPECFFWAVDFVVGHHVLILATSAYEFAGPTEIARTLFKAYNASATPREVDPFLLRFHSLQHSFIKSVAERRELWKNFDDPANKTLFGFRDLKWHPDWFYKFNTAEPQVTQMKQNWRRYERHINQLAA
jgi:hypothetical protein